MGTLNGLIKRMLSDEGYIEKASNKDLDSRNGGQVKLKTRPFSDPTVKGFC